MSLCVSRFVLFSGDGAWAGAWAEQLRRDARNIMLARGTGHKSRAEVRSGFSIEDDGCIKAHSRRVGPPGAKRLCRINVPVIDPFS
jgi:hypothetical protein